MDCTTNLVMSVQQHSPQCSCYCGCIHPMKTILVRGTWIPSLMRLKQFCIHRFVACKIPGQQQADLPVSRNSQLQEQNLMELAWLGPSTVRNPSVGNPSAQGAEWTWRTHSPSASRLSPSWMQQLAPRFITGHQALWHLHYLSSTSLVSAWSRQHCGPCCPGLPALLSQIPSWFSEILAPLVDPSLL